MPMVSQIDQCLSGILLNAILDAAIVVDKSYPQTMLQVCYLNGQSCLR